MKKILDPKQFRIEGLVGAELLDSIPPEVFPRGMKKQADRIAGESEVGRREVPCPTGPKCGFIAVVENDGRVHDGHPESRRTFLWKNVDGTYECPACGTPIKVKRNATIS